MNTAIHIALLAVALVVMPIAYCVLVGYMRRIKLDNPPYIPMFFTFGTVGGWVLAFALSPSGLTAMCIVFLITAAPVALLITSIRLSCLKNLTTYHRIPMWGGFAYPALLAVFLTLASLTNAT